MTLTHRNMTFVADSIIEYLEMDESERVMCVLPLSFGYGLYQLLTCVQRRRDVDPAGWPRFPGRVVQLLDEQAVTALPGVPTVFNVLLSLRGLGRREFPQLRVLTNAGAALPAATMAELRRVFPAARLYSMYGQTECQRVCYLPPSELDARPTSVGVAIPGTQAWVEDAGRERRRRRAWSASSWSSETTSCRATGTTPRRRRKRMRPGRWPWERVLATGDLFRTDEEGFLYFVGRRDDIIKSGGEKVPPREVEEVLHTAPGVREAAVVGVPDKILGEAVCGSRRARYRPRRRIPRRFAAIARSASRTTWSPAAWSSTPELPRTENGKLDRQALIGHRFVGLAG